MDCEIVVATVYKRVILLVHFVVRFFFSFSLFDKIEKVKSIDISRENHLSEPKNCNQIFLKFQDEASPVIFLTVT